MDRFLKQLLIFVGLIYVATSKSSEDEGLQQRNQLLEQRIQQAKLEMWQRGAFAFPLLENDLHIPLQNKAEMMERQALLVSRSRPVKQARRGCATTANSYQDCYNTELSMSEIADRGWRSVMNSIRGGDSNSISEESHESFLDQKLEILANKYGSEFREAIEKVHKLSCCCRWLPKEKSSKLTFKV